MAIKQPPKPRKFVQDEFTHLPHEDQHPEEHEHTDVNTRALVMFVAGFVVFAALTFVFLWVLFRLNAHEKDVGPVTLVPRAAEQLPPGTPPLQGVPGPKDQPRFDPNPPAEDMKLFRERNERILREGAEVNEGDRKVYVIPVAEAMRIALDKNIFQNEPKGQQQQQQQHQQQSQTGSSSK